MSLEVSSGGVARPLTMIDDYESFKYNKAKIVLKEKFLGKKTYKGFLKGVDKNGKILLETENHKIKFNFFEIEKANIDPNWAWKTINLISLFLNKEAKWKLNPYQD